MFFKILLKKKKKMKRKIYILTVFSILTFSNTFSQTVINTESTLNKIDSTFHLFLDAMGDYQKGNIEFFMIKSSLTIGSRFKEKNLIRMTFSNNFQKFNGNTFQNITSGQIRYNYFYNVEKHHSIFSFMQLGKSKRSLLNKRFLLGGGIRNRITPSENAGYIDLAYGLFYEKEKYPLYSFENTNFPSFEKNNLRLTFNIFTKLKINKHINLISVLYSQWKSNELSNTRIFIDTSLNYVIGKTTIFLKYSLRHQSKPYVPFIVDESDIMIGFRISI